MNEYTPLLDEPAVERVYREGENYRVQAGQAHNGVCYVFFSGNGLYFPNTPEEFDRTVVKGDRYEWSGIAKRIVGQAERMIFVRDVHKQWYLTGISAKVKDIDALTELLRSLTEGYTVITVGNSAGGYMACLMGLRLHAKYAYSFNGQFSLYLEEMETHPYLVRFREEKRELYRYDGWLKDTAMQTLYFYAGKCAADLGQYALVQDIETVHAIGFVEEKHGKNMLAENLPYALTHPERMMELSRTRLYTQLGFLFASCGVLRGCVALVRIFLRKSGQLLHRRGKRG